MTMLLEDLDLRVLLSDDVSCEIDHHYTECTGDVVGRITYICDEDANACASAVAFVHEGIVDNEFCECGLACSVCWNVRPI